MAAKLDREVLIQYSTLSPIIGSETHTLAKALPTSLNGRRMETPRDKHHYTAMRTSAVDISADNRQMDVQMTTIEDDSCQCYAASSLVDDSVANLFRHDIVTRRRTKL
jgi:hypothetical protein